MPYRGDNPISTPLPTLLNGRKAEGSTGMSRVTISVVSLGIGLSIGAYRHSFGSRISFNATSMIGSRDAART